MPTSWRLAPGEGTPLDSLRSERTNYRVNHEHASPLRRVLKYISVLPALILPRRHYHSFKHKLAANTLYARFRQKLLPFRRPGHVDRNGH